MSTRFAAFVTALSSVAGILVPVQGAHADEPCYLADCYVVSGRAYPSSGQVRLHYEVIDEVETTRDVRSVTLTVRTGAGLALDPSSVLDQGQPVSGVTQDADGLHVPIPTSGLGGEVDVIARPTATAAATEQVAADVSYQLAGSPQADVAAAPLTVHTGLDLTATGAEAYAPQHAVWTGFPYGYQSHVLATVRNDGLVDSPAGLRFTVSIGAGFALGANGVRWGHRGGHAVPCTNSGAGTWTCTAPALRAGSYAYVWVYVEPLRSTPLGTHADIAVSVPPDSDTSNDAAAVTVHVGGSARLRTSVSMPDVRVGHTAVLTVRATNRGPNIMRGRVIFAELGVTGRQARMRTSTGREVTPSMDEIKLPVIRPGHTVVRHRWVTPLVAKAHVDITVHQFATRVPTFDPGCWTGDPCGRSSTTVRFLPRTG